VQFSERTIPANENIHLWETGFHLDQVADIERIRDHALRAIYGQWAFLKNRSKSMEEYEHERLTRVGCIAGKRESRRLLGDLILTQHDVEERARYPDACVVTTWPIDLHYPQPENSRHYPGQEFIAAIRIMARIKPYPIPYRCFYSRNVDNLFMAGRNISVTHVALGTTRVMGTIGVMGEVVGMAAAVCARHDTDPRGVYENHLDKLIDLMRLGVAKE
jgi:hypothetical protein